MRKTINRLLPKAIGSYLNTLVTIAPEKAAERAFEIFSKPRGGRIDAHHKEFLDPAKDRLITVDNIKIQTYHWPGSGKTVLLVHGWESHTHRWRHLVKRLKAENYNIVSFDAPAHGYSEGNSLYVPLYEKALHEIAQEYHPKIYIGHSIGALTILYNQVEKELTDTEKIVLLGPPDKFESIITYFQNKLNLNQKVMTALDAYIFERFGFKAEEFSGFTFAEKIGVSGLIIHDEGDPITPYSGGHNIHKHWSISKLHTTQGLGHSLYGDEVESTILAFLKE